jgi:hypothetical protein
VSQPKRYALRLPDISYGTEESPNGEYVRYADYAALQAENERLHADNNVLLNPEKFPHRFAETCFIAGYKQGINDALKKEQS